MSTRTHPRPGRRERILLIVSLALNLAVAGVVAGFLLRGPLPERQALDLPIDGMRHVHRAMPKEERDHLRRDLRARFDQLPDRRAKMRALRDDMLAALRAEPFSAETLEAVMVEQSAYWQTASENARAVLVAHVARMSPEARVAFADALEQSMTHRHTNRVPRR